MPLRNSRADGLDEVQERRAIPIIDRIIRNSRLNDEGRVARIKDELSRLSNEPDDTIVRTMQSQFAVVSGHHSPGSDKRSLSG
jgi:hypothetical protein